MSKPSARPKQENKPTAVPVGRLDDSLADATTKTIQGIQKYRITLITLIGVVILAGFLFKAIGSLQLSNAQSSAGEIYKALNAPGVEDRDDLAHLGEVEKLLTDLRGASGETAAYKQALNSILARAERSIYPPPPSNPTGAPSEATSTEDNKVDHSDKLLEKAKLFAEQAKAHFANDNDMQEWANGVIAKVTSLGTSKIRKAQADAKRAKEEAEAEAKRKAEEAKKAEEAAKKAAAQKTEEAKKEEPVKTETKSTETAPEKAETPKTETKEAETKTPETKAPETTKTEAKPETGN